MNIVSARNASEFVHVLDRDSKDRPTRLLVPGHEGRQYEVILERNSILEAECHTPTSHIDGFTVKSAASGELFVVCKGNQHSICYHVLAAAIHTASEQGKELSWCETEQDAKRLARLAGKVFTVKSAQSGKLAYGVVKDVEPELAKMEVELTNGILPAAGLSKSELTRLAVEETGDKEQWYSGESVWVAEDAYLKNDGYYVYLCRTDGAKYSQSKSLAIIWYLDISNIEAGWQRYTSKQARDELFDRDSALPVERTQVNKNKLFKT